jgi:hypothetical protein
MGTRAGLHVLSFIKNIPITSFMKIHSISYSRPVLCVQTDEQREMESKTFNTTLVCVTNALEMEIWQQNFYPNLLFSEVEVR